MPTSSFSTVSPVLSTRLHTALRETLLILGMALVAPLSVATDLLLFEHRVSEYSFTEIIQTSFLVLCVVAFLGAAIRAGEARGFYILGAGGFTTMLIREQDYWIKSAWLVLVVLVAASCVALVIFRHRETVFQPLADFIDTKPYYLILFGMMFVVVFSRLFGSGSLIWNHAVTDMDPFWFKTTVQEGLELFGYTYMLAGSVLVALRVDQNRPLSEWRQ